VIFGGLVPYGEVWRTGANEATTFTTNQDLLVDGSFLAAGKYTLWTIPGPESWKVIFNSKMYPWGIDTDKKPYGNLNLIPLFWKCRLRRWILPWNNSLYILIQQMN
jgi:hypothetical protein